MGEQNDLSALIGVSGVPLITALTQWCKLLFPDMSPRLLAAVPIIWGLVINLGLTYTHLQDWPIHVALGVIAGLAAEGLYSTFQTVRNGGKTSNNEQQGGSMVL